jgi:imidazole glycerol phosphate synthase glutamine amidotransferase subunit
VRLPPEIRAAVRLVIVPTGTANLASVLAAFRRLGVEPAIAERAGDIEQASHVMLPGVGSFGASMARLEAAGFTGPLQARIAADRPTIAICVGHQLLFEASEENPGRRGLGIIPGEVGRFGRGVRVPQFGWNRITVEGEARVLLDGHAYFANSYRALAAPGCTIATAEHGESFIAALERGRLVGCQFHPELSGSLGARLLARFLELPPC